MNFLQNYRQQNNQGAPIQNSQNKVANGPQHTAQQPRTGNKTIKFENEFDFEQANNKFEELRLELAKLKVGTTTEETKSTEVQVN